MAGRRMCNWGGSVVEVRTLPEIKGNQHRTYFTGRGEQTKGWLQAAQHKRSGARGFSCPSDPATSTNAHNLSTPAFTLLLAEFRSFHVHVRAGALGSHGIGASLVADMSARLHAAFARWVRRWLISPPLASRSPASACQFDNSLRPLGRSPAPKRTGPP